MALHIQYSDVFNHDYSRQIKGIAPLTNSTVASAEVLYLYNFRIQRQEADDP